MLEINPNFDEMGKLNRQYQLDNQVYELEIRQAPQEHCSPHVTPSYLEAIEIGRNKNK